MTRYIYPWAGPQKAVCNSRSGVWQVKAHELVAQLSLPHLPRLLRTGVEGSPPRTWLVTPYYGKVLGGERDGRLIAQATEQASTVTRGIQEVLHSYHLNQQPCPVLRLTVAADCACHWILGSIRAVARRLVCQQHRCPTWSSCPY